MQSIDQGAVILAGPLALATKMTARSVNTRNSSLVMRAQGRHTSQCFIYHMEMRDWYSFIVAIRGTEPPSYSEGKSLSFTR